MTGDFSRQALRFDRIGYWTEVKLDIVKEYANKYTTILSKKLFRTIYIDGFAGPGVHLVRDTKELVPGSPLNALRIEPPFDEYYLVDLDGDKVDQLRSFAEVKNRDNVSIIHGDCNEVLLENVFPAARYEDYKRALCVLDPYGLHLNWEVIEMAGRMRSVEIFLNFPIMDMNRNALWRQPERVGAHGVSRMTAFWGDESWKEVAYTQQLRINGGKDDIKLDNQAVVDAFRERLIKKAGFEFVPAPMPMHNSIGAVVYFLFFASHQPVADKIVRAIFKKYRDRSS